MSELDISEPVIRYIYESQLYREKVSALISTEVSREQEQVWARHILTSDEEIAQGLYERLQNGEDFSCISC
jgi:parvulin-like peptidyl-prolyl isomerase